MPRTRNFSTFDFVRLRLHLCRVKSATVLFMLLFVCQACQRSEDTKLAPLYFDMPAYFQAEAKRLQTMSPAVEVRWEKDGEVELKTARQIDWEKAFAALGKLDLNRTAYRGSYELDSAKIGDREFIKYRAIDPAVKPQLLVLVKYQGSVQKLEVEVTDKNFLYETITQYSYVPDDTLSISGTQQVIFGKKHSYKRSYWY